METNPVSSILTMVAAYFSETSVPISGLHDVTSQSDPPTGQLKMVTAVYAEALQQLQHTLGLTF